tara:strand:- start:270 stop:770 length:501 start_codon:yes stop_codon:yes gene_type:complete
MTKIRLHIEIKIRGEWYYFTPQECLMLSIPCPKYPSSVFHKERWEYALLDNHFFIAALTGKKNPYNLIPMIEKDHIIGLDLPNDSTNRLIEELNVSEKLGNTITNIVCFKGSLFKDVQYWNRELYNGSMHLKYKDLIEDLPKWVILTNRLEKEFESYRFIFWIEER